MSLSVTIPEALARKLEEKAAATGRTAQEVALTAIQRDLSTEGLDQVLAPIRQAFKDSGLSEDEAVALFEDEKHALRRERRAGSK